jgi:hypothetical protein
VPSRKDMPDRPRSGKYSTLSGRGNLQAVQLRSIDGNLLRDAMDKVVTAGDAILFGRTSDGGAFSVRVLSDGATDCFYPTDAIELSELLTGILGL